MTLRTSSSTSSCLSAIFLRVSTGRGKIIMAVAPVIVTIIKAAASAVIHKAVKEIKKG